MTIGKVSGPDEDNMVDVDVDVDDVLVEEVCKFFDQQRDTRGAFITKEEFKFVPKHIQSQVKFAIIAAIALEAKVKKLGGLNGKPDEVDNDDAQS